MYNSFCPSRRNEMWICWVAMLTIAHSLWSLSWLVKRLSGAINFEYRIRPDWQDTMLLLATGFTNSDSAYDVLQWPLAFTHKSPWITTCCRLLWWKINCAYFNISVMKLVLKRGKKFVHSRKDLCDHPLPAFYSSALTTSASWAHLSHDGLCDAPGGVCPFNLIVGVQLRQQGTTVLSKNFE